MHDEKNDPEKQPSKPETPPTTSDEAAPGSSYTGPWARAAVSPYDCAVCGWGAQDTFHDPKTGYSRLAHYLKPCDLSVPPETCPQCCWATADPLHDLHHELRRNHADVAPEPEAGGDISQPPPGFESEHYLDQEAFEHGVTEWKAGRRRLREEDHDYERAKAEDIAARMRRETVAAHEYRPEYTDAGPRCSVCGQYKEHAHHKSKAERQAAPEPELCARCGKPPHHVWHAEDDPGHLAHDYEYMETGPGLLCPGCGWRVDDAKHAIAHELHAVCVLCGAPEDNSVFHGRAGETGKHVFVPNEAALPFPDPAPEPCTVVIGAIECGQLEATPIHQDRDHVNWHTYSTDPVCARCAAIEAHPVHGTDEESQHMFLPRGPGPEANEDIPQPPAEPAFDWMRAGYTGLFAMIPTLPTDCWVCGLSEHLPLHGPKSPIQPLAHDFLLRPPQAPLAVCVDCHWLLSDPLHDLHHKLEAKMFPRDNTNEDIPVDQPWIGQPHQFRPVSALNGDDICAECAKPDTGPNAELHLKGEPQRWIPECCDICGWEEDEKLAIHTDQGHVGWHEFEQMNEDKPPGVVLPFPQKAEEPEPERTRFMRPADPAMCAGNGGTEDTDYHQAARELLDVMYRYGEAVRMEVSCSFAKHEPTGDRIADAHALYSGTKVERPNGDIWPIPCTCGWADVTVSHTCAQPLAPCVKCGQPREHADHGPDGDKPCDYFPDLPCYACGWGRPLLEHPAGVAAALDQREPPCFVCGRGWLNDVEVHRLGGIKIHNFAPPENIPDSDACCTWCGWPDDHHIHAVGPRTETSLERIRREHMEEWTATFLEAFTLKTTTPADLEAFEQSRRPVPETTPRPGETEGALFGRLRAEAGLPPLPVERIKTSPFPPGAGGTPGWTSKVTPEDLEQTARDIVDSPSIDPRRFEDEARRVREFFSMLSAAGQRTAADQLPLSAPPSPSPGLGLPESRVTAQELQVWLTVYLQLLKEPLPTDVIIRGADSALEAFRKISCIEVGEGKQDDLQQTDD